MYLYKIVSPKQWENSQEQKKVELTSFDDAFIHFAQEDQVNGVIQKFWFNKPHIVLKIDSEKLVGTLVLERNKPEGEQYYHLYNGSIPLSSVLQT